MAGIIDFLLARRSVPVAMLEEPGPDVAQLQKILTAGARVPDHGKLAPWRFIVFQGDARTSFGNVLADILLKKNPDAGDKKLEDERQRFARAPLVLGVISSPVVHPKVPEWEQVLSAGAACQNILIASNGLGFGAQWLSQWPAFDKDVERALNLGEAEKIAGFIYIGTARESFDDRRRPNLDEITQYWTG
ncbi:MAG: nitroreductase [Rhizobiales bacterium]|nr:nitroreductase [Hyphomicrobiales bacterium]